MNGIHDMGGMHGFGAVPVDDDAAFHEPWEQEVYAMHRLVSGQGHYGTDEFRSAIERLEPATYLNSTYFERWYAGFESLLTGTGVLSEVEIERRRERLAAGEPVPEVEDADLVDLARDVVEGDRLSGREASETRFEAGDDVVVRNVHPEGHTRVPRYARRARGEVNRVLGAYPLADAAARGEEVFEPLYSVRFPARELWGDDRPRTDAVNIDMWESYLAEP